MEKIMEKENKTTPLAQKAPCTEKVIFDTDPGVDDAIALLYAATQPNLQIELLSSAGGNGPIENITANALHLCNLLGITAPVAQGSPTPLKRPAHYAFGAQGKSGLGSYEYDYAKISGKPLPNEAFEEIYKILTSGAKKSNQTSAEKYTIISIGPMTNLAKLLLAHPDCKKHIKQIVFESGTKEKIYGKPYKSFNVGYDPEAAEVVFKSGIPLVMVPMELGHIAYLDKDEIKRFKNTNALGKIYAKMFAGYNDFHVGKLGAAVHDACAVYYLCHPEDIKTEKAFIEIKYYPEKDAENHSEGNHPKGNPDEKNCDEKNQSKKNSDQENYNEENYGYVDIDFSRKPNATVCMDLNIAAFKANLFEALEKYNDKKY